MPHMRLIAIALVTTALVMTPTLAAAQAAPPRAAAITSSHAASLTAVPKFIFHAGLAFGAFHHFIYLPFKAGKFTSGGFFSKLKTYTAAALAALFVYHETKLALQDAKQNKVLKALVAPLTAAIAGFNTVVAKVKSHGLDTTTLNSAQSSLTAIESQAKKVGSSVPEAIPTTKQLLTGSA
jgi:hypothetical protein